MLESFKGLPISEAVKDLEYEVLAWLASGHSVFSPPDRSDAGYAAFIETVDVLMLLRDRGWVGFPDGRLARTSGGTYVALGPVDLTTMGRAALERDRRLGERPPLEKPLPWHTG
jgi:hypothetical protein